MQNTRGNNLRQSVYSSLLLACVAAIATAGASPLDAQATQAPPAAATGASTATSPGSNNTADGSCVSLMPNGLQTLQGKNIPVLVVRIGLDAKLHDAQLSRSSGDQDLDK